MNNHKAYNLTKPFKKGLSRTIIFLIVSMMGIGNAWADTWDGKTMYTTIATANIKGTGDIDNPYIIDNANKFVAFGTLANSDTKYWKLTVDINLGGYEWPYSGNNAKTFQGHFDGDNHTVSNYTITPINNKANGLFGTVKGNNATTGRAEIKNLKIDDVTINTTTDLGSTTYIGSLIGNVSQYVDLKNVQIIDVDNNKTTVSITLDNLTGNCYIGGLIGAFQKNSTIENCTANIPVVTVKGEGSTIAGTCYIGGVIGYFTGASSTEVSKIDKPTSGSTNGLTVSSSSVTVHKILSSWYIGSAIGRINNYSDINYVTIANPTLIYKAVGSPNNALYLGTLTGHLQGNAGSSTVTPVSTPVKNIKITGTSNITIGTGSEEIKNVKAGIVGQATTNVDIDNWNIATSNITAKGSLTTSTDYFGGVIGQVSSAKSTADTDIQTKINNVTLTKSTISVTGDVVKESYIGSIFGRIEGNAGDATNKPKRTIITGVSATGTTKVVFGSSKAPVSIANTRAGAVGFVGVNSEMSGCTLFDTQIEIHGNLTTSSSYLGGIVSHIQSSTTAFAGIVEGEIATKIKDITVKNSNVNVSGNVEVQSYVGSGFGRVEGVTSTTVAPQPTSITGIKFKNDGKTGISKVTIGTTPSTNTINYVRTGVAGMAYLNVIIDDWEIENNNIQINGKFQSTASHIGGCVGTLQSNNNGPVKVSNAKITESDIIAINGDVDTKEVYVGGAFGRIEPNNKDQNKSPHVEEINIAGLDISFGGDFKQNVYAGGIAGYLTAVNSSISDPSSIVNCYVKGQIHSNGNHTFKENATYAFGGIVGYTGQSDKNISEIRLCTSNVDFNLSGLTPATKTNLYCNGFVVGGIIGRIDTPSRLPEHLYYTGKIYAPYAAVSPIVGVFYTKIAAATYLYDDYIGINATYLTPEEWLKANTWYYNNYKLGLSEDVIKQTTRTKNYKISPIKEDDVNYLLIDDKVFDRPNAISGTAKNSSTVLAYNASGSDTDFGIYPAWNTNSTTYPSYYMYYMQGLNRGTYTPDEEVNFVMTLMDNGVTYNPTLTRTGNDQTGFIFTVSSGDLENNERFTITYQWYQSDKTTPIIGETGKTLSISKDALETFGNTIYCVVTVSGDGFNDVSRTLQGTYTIVVFVDGTKGIDNKGTSRERGWTPETAVRTIDHANSLLANAKNGGTWDKNIIVVMGILNDDHKFQSSGRNPATLTGKWDGVDYKGVIRLAQIDPAEGEHSLNMANQPGKKGSNCYILGDTKFENLTFYGKQGGNAFIELHGHNAFFGKGLVMQNFKNLSKEHGNFGGVQKIPEFTIILTATNLGETDIQEYTRNRTKPQEVTFQSGHYGRIMAGRFTQDFFAKTDNSAHSILASAKNPLWAVIKIAIDKDNEMTDGLGNAYSCDINAVIAGLTDGTMYGDMEINFHGGNVAYIVGSNQGNAINNGNAEYTPIGSTKSGNYGQWPNSSYFGRTVINIEQDPDAKNITVGNLYTGGLGRKVQSGTATAPVDMYLYGQTEVNVKSGTVGSVYGGGVGGVIGINPWDAHLPYATTATNDATAAIQNGVQYGDTRQGNWSNLDAATAPMAKVILHNYNENNGTFTTEALDLSKSSTTINITGGNINGSVFGGGYGYVPDMPEASVVQGVGSVFGTSNINISGGNISGSVYGGSQGASNYYGKTNTYGQTITHIAEMNGTINLKISGTDAIWPTIGGNIYGGGAGVSTSGKQEYLRIATTGNNDLGNEFKTDYSSSINVIIDLPKTQPFKGNIYGGGEMGLVDGNTKVIIKDGIIKGDIFGGGKGEIGHPDKAKVTGDTNVIVVDKK